MLQVVFKRSFFARY